MTTIIFDTLKFVEYLKASGMPEAQAKAIAEAFRAAQGEAELAISQRTQVLPSTALNSSVYCRRSSKIL